MKKHVWEDVKIRRVTLESGRVVFSITPPGEQPVQFSTRDRAIKYLNDRVLTYLGV